MTTGLNNLSIVHIHNAVCPLNRRKSVRNDEGRSSLQKLIQTLLQCNFGLCVNA